VDNSLAVGQQLLIRENFFVAATEASGNPRDPDLLKCDAASSRTVKPSNRGYRA
jgi:hypothetical protein